MKTRTSSPVRWAIAAALFVLVGCAVCRAQIDMYIKFLDGTGVWAGESTASGRTGWSDLKSASFGAAIPVTFGGGGGTTIGRTTFQDITIAKLVDRLTPQIFSNLAGGTSLNAGGSNSDGQAADKSRAKDDADGDGLDTLHEFIAHTNPRLPQSTLRVTGVQQGSPANYTLTWLSVVGLNYRVESGPAPSGPWTFVRSVASSGNGTTSTVVAGAPPRMFYRVSTP